MNAIIRAFIFTTWLVFNFVPRGQVSAEVIEQTKLKFVVLGDIGGIPRKPYSLWTQELVSKQVAMIPDVDFFVTTGDNFYYNGVTNVTDFRFFATYERVYHYPSLQKKWYMIAGNHDYHGNVTAQILYTQISNRWTFPYFYYTKIFQIPDTNKTLQIVMIDTMSLCFERVTRRKSVPPAEIQMEWIQRTLNDSTADYLIAVGHQPMFSVGAHGSSSCLQNMLYDLFKQRKVNAYISGHDHNLQHLSIGNSSLQHFVCGSSNWVDNWQEKKPNLGANTLKVFIGDKPGYMLVEVTEDTLKFELRTTEPEYKYNIIEPPRNKLSYDDKPLQDFFFDSPEDI